MKLEFVVSDSKKPYLIFGLGALTYFIWWYGILQFPLELTSDDALNFSRSVERFSVLEFRPHFPGYPAFVVMCRFMSFVVRPDIANVWVSLISVSLIPLIVGQIVFLLSRSLSAAFFSFLILLHQPLLTSIALSGLSDSMALVFFLTAIAYSIKYQYKHVGLFLGLMLATRPSYFPLAILLFLLPLFISTNKRMDNFIKIVLPIFLIGIICLIFVCFYDGMAYFDEGLRFTQGHFNIWGNTVSEQESIIWQWFNNLNSSFGFLFVHFILFTFLYIPLTIFSFSKRINIFKRSKKYRSLIVISFTALVYWGWITVAQNPDNLRHWSPVLILFFIVFPVLSHQALSSYCEKINRLKSDYIFLILLVFIPSIFSIYNVSGKSIFISSKQQPNQNESIKLEPVKQAPIQQAISWIINNPDAENIGINYSVNLVKEQVKNRIIYDMYYPSNRYELQKKAKIKSRSSWRISGSELNQHRLVRTFSARFVGEKTLYLYTIE